MDCAGTSISFSSTYVERNRENQTDPCPFLPVFLTAEREDIELEFLVLGDKAGIPKYYN